MQPGEACGRRGGCVLKPGELEVADPSTLPVEHKRVDAHRPQDAHQAQTEEILHDHPEDVLGSDHAAVEECEPRSHEHDESR